MTQFNENKPQMAETKLEMSAMTSCAAAFGIVTYGRYGPGAVPTEWDG